MEIDKNQTTMKGRLWKLANEKFEVITDYETEMGGFEKNFAEATSRNYPWRTKDRPADRNE